MFYIVLVVSILYFVIIVILQVWMCCRCKGFVGVPSTGGHVVGDCWLILTRMTLNDEEYRRIYFYQVFNAMLNLQKWASNFLKTRIERHFNWCCEALQPQHMNKGYKMQESTHDHRCMCCVGQGACSTSPKFLIIYVNTIEQHMIIFASFLA